jgi:hypothetical protein
VASGNVTTPGTIALSVSVDPGALTAGSYPATLSVTNPSGSSIPIVVNLTVTAAPVNLTVSPGSLTAALTAGGPAVTQTVTLQNPGSAAVPFALGVLGSGFLSVSAATSTVPAAAKNSYGTATLQITINPATLSAGITLGDIIIVPASGSSLLVGVNVIARPTGSSCQASNLFVSVVRRR